MTFSSGSGIVDSGREGADEGGVVGELSTSDSLVALVASVWASETSSELVFEAAMVKVQQQGREDVVENRMQDTVHFWRGR